MCIIKIQLVTEFAGEQLLTAILSKTKLSTHLTVWWVVCIIEDKKQPANHFETDKGKNKNHTAKLIKLDVLLLSFFAFAWNLKDHIKRNTLIGDLSQEG